MEKRKRLFSPSSFAPVLGVIFVLTSLVPLGAAPEQTQGQAPGRQEEALPLLSPGATVRHGYVYALGGRIGAELTQLYLYDPSTGAIQIRVDSGVYQLVAETDPEGNLKYSQWTTPQEALSKLLGHDRRCTFYDRENGKIRIEYYRGDQLTTTKTFSYERDILDSDLIFLSLPEKLARYVAEFKGDVLLKARGMRIKNVTFRRETVKELTAFSPEYDFPGPFFSFFDRVLQAENEVYVYVMELPGVYQLLYPHKYYTAFAKTAPYRWLASWGGAPRDADFLFLVD